MDSDHGISPEDRLGIDLARSENRLIRQLIEMRERRGLKPAELAREMGVDRSVVTRFEAGGTNPTIATINRYAEAVGAMIHYDVTDHAVVENGPVARLGTKRSAAGRWSSVTVEVSDAARYFTPGAPDTGECNPSASQLVWSSVREQ